MGDQDRGITDSSPALGTDGTVYIGAKDGLLYAINLDGTLKWAFETGDDVDTAPVSDLTEPYMRDQMTAIFMRSTRMEAESGHLRRGDDVDSSPALASDGTVYMKSDDDYLYAINSDGTQKWKFDIGDHSSLKV